MSPINATEYIIMTPLSAAVEYFAEVSQQALKVKPPYRGVVNMLHFGDYILVKSEIVGEINRRWFHQETPIYYYYLPKDMRLPLVRDMCLSGCSTAEIAELIGLSKSTISNDIKEIKDRLGLEALMPIMPHEVTPKDVILKSSINQKQKHFITDNRWLLD